MGNPIVIVEVSQQLPPNPNKLQKTGALISQGGTILGVQDYALLTQPDDLTDLLPAPLAISTLSFSASFGGQVTATASAAHGVAVGEEFVTTIDGAIPAGYNGTFLATATTTTAFTYYLPGPTPGAETTPGTYTARGVGDLQAMVATFFAQGLQQAVYVLECGAGEPAAGVANLSSFITSSPQFFYGYLVPRNWSGVTSFMALIATLNATTAKTYFFITAGPQTVNLYPETDKSALVFQEAQSYGAWPTNVISAASYSGGSITATTTTAHGVSPGQVFTIVGATPAGYNGTFVALPGTTGSTLIYAVPADPGMISIEGTLVQSLYASAGVPPTEFSHAADFYRALNYDPSTTNRVAPFQYGALLDVTPYPVRGNSALIATLDANFISYAFTGGEGGLTSTFLRNGKTKDGQAFNYWYSVDWMQINVDLNIANAIINGSNTGVNPLYYNDDGIIRLGQVAISTGTSAISFGLALGKPILVNLDAATFLANLNKGTYAGQLVVNAQPFAPYTLANPNDYKQGLYKGLTMVYTPLQGFDQIVFQIVVTQFVQGV